MCIRDSPNGYPEICPITYKVLWESRGEDEQKTAILEKDGSIRKYDKNNPRAVAVMMWFKLRVLIKSRNAIMYWNELVHRPTDNNLNRLFSEL